MKIGSRSLLIVVAVCLNAAFGFGADSFPEYKVKAAFVFNFVKFVKWPEGTFRDKEQAIEVAIIGSDPFGEILDETFKGKRIDGREIAIVRNPSSLSRAQLLFVCRSRESGLDEILAATKGKPVLTVSEIPGFAKKQGMVEMRVQEQQVCFDLNQRLIQEAGLLTSGQMVKIARSVYH